MARLILLVLSILAAAANCRPNLTKQKFFETFSVPGDTNTIPGQDPDNLTVPINGLYWKNLYSAYQVSRFNSGPLFDIAIKDPFFYGAFTNASKPAVITSKYRGSCVDSWTLQSFAFGCVGTQTFYYAPQNETLTWPLPSNCTVTVEGLDRRGRCVGREVFQYEPYPLFNTVLGFPAGYMGVFNTTRRGLKGVKLEKVRIGVKVRDIPDDIYTYVGGLGAGIDAVSYTVFNRTGCR